MATEQEKTLDALRIAIRMETSGQEYYLKAGRESNNELGKKLLESLSTEEAIHRQKFEKIYDTIRSQKAWPVITFQPGRAEGLRTIFARATEELCSTVRVLSTELGAIEKAMEMENKTYDFYKSQEEKTSYDAEKDFYQSLAAEERGHYLVLLDYYEYLKDPAGWFVNKEHPSLDGG